MGADRATQSALDDGSIASLPDGRKREMVRRSRARQALAPPGPPFPRPAFRGSVAAAPPIPAGRPEPRSHRTPLRDSLTVLAILLIGVLTAALVGPYVVDWDSHRAVIERKLSEAAGTPVTVTGPIALRLLPKPLFRFGGVTVGDGAGGRPRLGAQSLDAELSLTALMRGQVQVVDTTLVRPRLDLVQAKDGGFGVGLPSGAAADRVAFDHLGLRDGTVDLTLGDGRHATVTGIDLDASATSLRGPFKAAGRIGTLPFHLGTGALDAGGLRLKLALDGDGTRPGLDLDGVVSARPGGLGPGFDGHATATGQVRLGGTTAAVPWRATARLSADRDGARGGDVELRAGADLRALIAAGEGAAAYPAGPALPQAHLKLQGAVLDVDDLAVAPAGSDVAPPQGLDVVRRLVDGISDGARLVSLPLRLDLGASFDTATLAGRTLLGTSATLGLGPEPSAALTVTADGPQGARLALDGRVEPGPPTPVSGPFGAAPASSSPVFRGRAEVRSNDRRATAAWIRPAAPALADWLAGAVPGRSVVARATVDASATGIVARDLDLHVDGSAFAGTLSFNRAVGSERARLFADLSSDALALDRLPDLSGAAAASRDLDLDLALTARAVTLAASAAGDVPIGPFVAGQVALRATKVGDDSRLQRLTLDLDGGRLDAQGSRDPRGARAQVHLSAPQLGPFVDALAPLLPTAANPALRSRAGLLSPVDATLTVEAAADDGGLAPTAFTLAGTAGGTRIDASLAPDGPAAGRDADHRPVTVSLRAEAPAGADLIRLLGVGAPGPVAGPARATGTAKGTLADGFTGGLDASLGDTAVSYAGRAGAAGGAGRLTLRSPDLRPVVAGLGVPPSSTPLAAQAAGDLAWDAAALRWGGLSGQVGGSGVTGELSLDLAPQRAVGAAPPAVLHGRLAVDRLPAGALIGLALGPAGAPAAGRAWPSQPFAPAPVGLPRAEVALTVADLPLQGGLAGRAVSLMLRTAPDSVAATDIAGGLGTGRVGGALAIRRDGDAATLSGRLTWSDVAVAAGDLGGRVGGTAEIAASGTSMDALAASLAGSGTLSLSGASLARTDPGAPARVLAAVTARDIASERGSEAAEPTPLDVPALRDETAAALDAAPLPIGAVDATVTLAGGVLRLGPLKRTGTVVPPKPGQGGPAAADWAADIGLALDLDRLALTSRVVLRTAAGGGDVVVSRQGPFAGATSREVDVAGLAEAVQAQAIARAQERIDVIQQDIRERAAFNRQLKAIAQRQQAEREQAEAARQAEVARAAAEVQARVAAARAAVQAAAEAQKAAAEAQKAAAEAQKAAADERRATLARQKAEDARMQAQVEAAARAEAAHDRDVADEAAKQRFIDRALKATDPPLDSGGRGGPLAPPPEKQGRDPLDPPPPSSIQERGASP